AEDLWTMYFRYAYHAFFLPRPGLPESGSGRRRTLYSFLYSCNSSCNPACAGNNSRLSVLCKPLRRTVHFPVNYLKYFIYMKPLVNEIIQSRTGDHRLYLADTV